MSRKVLVAMSAVAVCTAAASAISVTPTTDSDALEAALGSPAGLTDLSIASNQNGGTSHGTFTDGAAAPLNVVNAGVVISSGAAEGLSADPSSSVAYGAVPTGDQAALLGSIVSQTYRDAASMTLSFDLPAPSFVSFSYSFVTDDVGLGVTDAAGIFVDPDIPDDPFGNVATVNGEPLTGVHPNLTGIFRARILDAGSAVHDVTIPLSAGVHEIWFAIGDGELLGEPESTFDSWLLVSPVEVRIIPEPLTLAGAAMGLAALGGYLRRRRR